MRLCHVGRGQNCTIEFSSGIWEASLQTEAGTVFDFCPPNSMELGCAGPQIPFEMPTSRPPTEEPNELSDNLDSLDALGFVRVLRGVDAQIFAGWRQHEGLLDNGPLARAEAAAQVAAVALSLGGIVVLTGCGTSGRVAHLVVRRMQRLLPAEPRAFDYLISGGDAALLLSDELPEDDPIAGAAQLSELALDRAACVLIGISCGLSAPYVAGQLDHALCAPSIGSADIKADDHVQGTRFGAVAIGFNPAEHARDNPVSGLRSGARSFRDLTSALMLASKPGKRDAAASHALVNPVIGPEAVAGSSRMKGGSATLILADAICYRALQLSRGASAPLISDFVDKAHDTTRRVYAEAQAIAQVCELAATAMRSGGRLYYLGEGTAGLLGCIDASEMPDTYGVPFDTVRGFVCGGWADVANREGNLDIASLLLRLSLADFYEDVLPRLTSADAVVLLGCVTEPWLATDVSTPHAPDFDPNFDGRPSHRLWESVLKLRQVKTGAIAFLAATCSADAPGLHAAAAAAQLDACAIVPLPATNLGPGHSALTELALKLMLNLVSTYAMTARGLVYRNRMVGTSPTNDKIYHRCVHMISELADVSPATATTALLRSIYRLDSVSATLMAAPTAEHIVAATPTGEAQFAQQLVLPVAILLALDPRSTVAASRKALTEEPRVSMLIRKLRPTAAPADGQPTMQAFDAVAASHSSIAPTPVTRDRYVLALDLGATSIKSAAFRVSDGALVGSVARTSIGAKDLDAVVTALRDAASETLLALGEPNGWSEIAAVGLSQPGAIDAASGRVSAAANFPWRDAPLREALQAALGTSVTMIEDADAALLAELQPGGAAASTVRPHVAALLVIGGGVGSSLAIDGRIHRGANGLSEAGHLIVERDGLVCECGQRGCLEKYASGPAIAQRASRLVNSLTPPGACVPVGDSLLATRYNERREAGGSLTAKDVFEAAAVGDSLALRAVDDAAEALASACIAICRIVDPHVIVFAGGVATPSLLTATQAAFKRLTWTLLPTMTSLVLATAAANAGVTGAAAAARASAAASMPSARRTSAFASSDHAYIVRQATKADRAAALRVCLLTGNMGADASASYVHDADALGKRWVAPYLELEPDFAFVLEEGATKDVVGYCLAARDTPTFSSRLQTDYLPPLRASHPDPRAAAKPEAAWTPEEHVYVELHDHTAGAPPPGVDMSLFPSHLHIDLAPSAQGKRQGHRLMAAQLGALQRAGSPGVYLQMHKSNARARRFYEKLGFIELTGANEQAAMSSGTGGAFFMGLRL
jgi:N-acetylmuramic acid 6-phosphate (MurNAc-6-P) etherase/predicted NBD/HSP70 family sugar kinase/ribosomal protein S18 acetylase RimI-like enzyme